MTTYTLPAGYSLGTRGKAFVFTCSRGMSGDFASAEVVVTAAHLDEAFILRPQRSRREWLLERLPPLAVWAHSHGWRSGMTLTDLGTIIATEVEARMVADGPRTIEYDDPQEAAQRRLWDSIAAANAEHDG